MPFLRVKWRHDDSGEPIEIYSQLDSTRFEVRKIEVFRDGTVQLAGPEVEQGDTYLSETAIPDVEAINADPDFSAEPIPGEQFWDLWRMYISQSAE